MAVLWRNRNQNDRLFDSGFAVFDTVIDEIAKSVGSLPPESGGALLGGYSTSTVVRFVYDPAAQVTGASFIPSRQLTEEVQKAENAYGLQFKGVLHSHPGSFDRPSGPDHSSFLDGLVANPELGRYLAPIVTFSPGGDSPNKLQIASSTWMSFYVAIRDRNGVAVHPCMPRMIWFARDCRRLAESLGMGEPSFSNSPLGEQFAVSASFQLDQRWSLVLAAAGGYPEVSPLALLHDVDTGETRQLTLKWLVTADPDDRLERSLADINLPLGQRVKRLAYGRNNQVLTQNARSGRDLGLDPVLVGDDYADRLGKVSDGLFARSRGVLSDRVSQSHVVILGCGSVGSYAAEQFARSGIGNITLIDPDEVEYSNLSRANFTSHDVGRSKVSALAERLISIAPNLAVYCRQSRFQDFEADEIEGLFGSASLVVSALDDRPAQLMINQWSYWLKVPAVFIGIFARARGGEVCIVRPPNTCFNCATQFRDFLPTEVQGEHDYGTGRLVAEVALGVDIHSVTAIGVRLGLACLMHGTESTLATFADKAALEQSYAVFGVTEDFEIVSELLSGAPAQLGHRSVWLSPSRRVDCNVCGPEPDTPMVARTPSSAEIIAAIGQSATALVDSDSPIVEMTTPSLAQCADDESSHWAPPTRE